MTTPGPSRPVRRSALRSAARLAGVPLLLGAVLVPVAACESASPASPSAVESPGRTSTASTASSGSSPAASPVMSATASASRSPSASAGSPSASAGSPSASVSPARRAQLPRGGRSIYPEHRVVAFYGASGAPSLGVLGSKPPEDAAEDLERRAASYAGYGRPVLPAMELITTVAQASAGKDGDYSAPTKRDNVRRYLEVAHRHKMLLLLDFQPGRGEFLPQVKQFDEFLGDPSVGVALDPEWKVGPHERPGRVIGESSAADINEVSAYLAAIVAKHDLPEKLFVVHQFTDRMLPDRERIAARPGLATVLHADGNGSPAVKRAVYRQLDFPPPFHAGFKLFFTEDTRLMKPAEVMALRPEVELITYQ